MKKLLGILLFISIALSANAQLLWKVSGKGLEKPSYIFGTYHLSPLSIKDSIAAMPQAMSETAQVYGPRPQLGRLVPWPLCYTRRHSDKFSLRIIAYCRPAVKPFFAISAFRRHPALRCWAAGQTGGGRRGRMRSNLRSRRRWPPAEWASRRRSARARGRGACRSDTHGQYSPSRRGSAASCDIC